MSGIKLPDQILKSITGAYVSCDGLSSNFVKFFLPPSPKLVYMISKDKKPIQPGSTLIIK
jgi:hypothetical protein